ncbi:MAG: type II toxin-antitoxin system RelE/ParE family toxin [Sulfurospirillum sp.]|nr:MAG: type II toxin-antitoxin system RelE/ParE family toxin [Sulfurospirillum sp.]
MYTLHILTSAKKELKKLDHVAQQHIKEKLILLVENPEILKNNIKPLKGEHKGLFRLRVNQYRVIFQIKEDKLIITIVRIGHRKEVY